MRQKYMAGAWRLQQRCVVSFWLTLPNLAVHVGLDFTGMPFDVAFRYMLTNGGFFLPGEAQKIDRVTQAFARAYVEMNTVEDPDVLDGEATSDIRMYRPSNSDVAEVLTFSLIMLHTDAHNPNIKKEKKMTKAQFVSNNR